MAVHIPTEGVKYGTRLTHNACRKLCNIINSDPARPRPSRARLLFLIYLLLNGSYQSQKEQQYYEVAFKEEVCRQQKHSWELKWIPSS